MRQPLRSVRAPWWLRSAVASLLLCAALSSCAAPQIPAPRRAEVPGASAGAAPPATPVAALPPAPARALTAPERLRSLSDRYWTALLDTGPIALLGEGLLGGPLFATALGDHRFDAQLDDLSPEAHARTLDLLDKLRAESLALDPQELAGEDAVTLPILRAQLEDARAVGVCKGELWLIDQMNGPQVALPQTALYYPLGTAKGAAELAARYGQVSRLFDQLIANLRRGLAQDLTTPRGNVQRTLDQVRALAGKDAAHSDFLPPEARFQGLPADQRGPARESVRRAIEESVLPGLRRYQAFLETEALPKARTEVGLWSIPLGEACYAFLGRYHTGSARPPQELHQLGLAELAKIEAEQEQIALSQGARKAKNGHVDLRAFTHSLTKRRDQVKRTADELLDWNKATLARAMRSLPQAFTRMPPRPIETRPIEAYRAASNVPAFYQPAPDDGSQPAIYYVNTYKPGTRLLFNEEALCFHETVPGHHLQGTLAQELKGLPDFRRQLGETAYVEGWALYSERMSDADLHLYSSPIARYGMLGYQAWRASRLVVDTGMHALHWDRARALQYLKDHTTLTPDEAANEIDRYIVMPAQALAYMVGELEIYRLRHEAEQKLGSKFDLKSFHDVVLDHGAIPMTILAHLVDAWVSSPH